MLSEKTRIPLSVLIPTRNERENISRCLKAISGWTNEIVIADSQSDDATEEIAESFGADVIQFEYSGGWPKKRQWALNTYPFRNEWILLLDADEILLSPIKREIESAISSSHYDGYWLRFQVYFMGRQLKYGGFDLWKLSLFKRDTGRFEKRLDNHTTTMSDIEIHEHVVVNGSVGRLKNPIRHENFNSLYRYIEKHNEYSEWEANVYLEGHSDELTPDLFGTQAQRRRWLKIKLVRVPGFPLMTFCYHYFVRFGILDGKPGLIYCGLKGIQRFHAKAKMLELRQRVESNR